MKNVYATIFTKTKNGVLVEVPDMGILTEGESMVDAIEMARDAIGIKGIAMEDLGEKIPESSEVINVKKGVFAAEGISTVSLVDVDFGIYRKMQDIYTFFTPLSLLASKYYLQHILIILYCHEMELLLFLF